MSQAAAEQTFGECARAMMKRSAVMAKYANKEVNVCGGINEIKK